MATKETPVSPAANASLPVRDQARDQARDKAIDVMLAAIDKQFGKGAIMRLGKDPIDREVHVIPTGSLGLDLALGIGGLPRGRVVEIYGPESSGKTTLTLHVVAEAQKRGGVCAFIDASTRSTSGTPRSSGSRPRSSWSASRTPARRAAMLASARKFYQFWSTGDEDLLRQAISDGFVDHTLPRVVRRDRRDLPLPPRRSSQPYRI